MSPRTVLPIGYLLFVGFTIVLAWSALRHRQAGWGYGLMLAILLIFLPFWVLGGYHVFELITGNSVDAIPNVWPAK
jgi:hypothetical protein